MNVSGIIRVQQATYTHTHTHTKVQNRKLI